MLLDLPSGLKVEARRIQGAEAIAMAEKAKSTSVSGNAIARLLTACTERVVVPGPYDWIAEEATNLDWMGTLTGDLISGLIQLRSGSMRVKDRYVFRQECGPCEEAYAWSVPLLKLPKRMLPESSIAVLRGEAKGLFKTEIERVDGNGKIAATFKLPTSKDDEPMRKLLKQLGRRKITVIEQVAIAARSFNGRDMPVKARHDFAQTLELDDVHELLARFRDADCGVDTRIYTRCPDCNRTQGLDLPFGESFFNPQEGERLEMMGIKVASDDSEEKTTTTPAAASSSS